MSESSTGPGSGRGSGMDESGMDESGKGGSDPGDDRAAEGAWIVHGRVQGVGFRYWTLREARRRGLAGRVENLPDGSVRAMARGPAAEVRAFARALERGPTLARVRRIEEIPCTLGPEVRDFTIE